jgi:hypothetical protein
MGDGSEDQRLKEPTLGDQEALAGSYCEGDVLATPILLRNSSIHGS